MVLLGVLCVGGCFGLYELDDQVSGVRIVMVLTDLWLWLVVVLM